MTDTVKRSKNITSVISTNSRIVMSAGEYVYYSQIVEGIDDVVRCYQANDPTDPEVSDLLKTDGGDLRIIGAGTIQSLAPFRNGFIAVADKGAWYVSGSSDSQFAADDVSLKQVTDFGIKYPRSLVVVGDSAIYMSEGGMVAVQANEYGDVKGTMVTDQTIKTYYQTDFLNNSPATDAVVGVFDATLNEAHWVNLETYKVLILSLKTSGFYPQQFGEGDTSAWSDTLFTLITGATPEDGYEYIWIDGDSTLKSTKMQNRGFTDLGVSYPSYLEAGLETLGAFSNKHSVTSYSVAFDRTEEIIESYDATGAPIYDYPSSCMISIRYDDSRGYLNIDDQYVSPPKSSRQRQAYRLSPREYKTILVLESGEVEVDKLIGNQIVSFTDKIRGGGKLSSFRFEAEEGKDLQLLGMSVEYNMKGRQR